MARANERSPAVTGDSAVLARQIDGYLASKASPLTGLGAVFVAESEAVGLDPRFLVAIAGSETSFGTYGPSQTIHNPFGMGPHIVYASWSDGIRAAAQNLGGNLYAGSGLLTIPAIQAPLGAPRRQQRPHQPQQQLDPQRRHLLRRAGRRPPGRRLHGQRGRRGAGGAATTGLPVVPGPVAVRTPTPVLGSSGKGAEAAQEALGQLGTTGPWRAAAEPETRLRRERPGALGVRASTR